MKASLFYAIVILTSASSPILGEQNLDSIQKMEASGDTTGARTALSRAAQANPKNVAAWTAYAEFLDRYGDPGAREAYSKLLIVLRNGGNSARAAAVSRHLALLDLLAGDRNAANTHLEAYRASGGKAVTLGTPPAAKAPGSEGTATIPGPMRSFARMAAISPAMPTRTTAARAGAQRGHQRLPGLAQQRGAGADRVPEAGAPLSFPGAGTGETGRRLEGHQDRELRIARGGRPAAHPRLPHARRLRLRSGARNRQRARAPSSPPIPASRVNELEEALRTNRPFTYDFHPTTVPVLFGADYWTGGQGKEGSAISSSPSSPIPRFAGSTWAFPSSTPKPPKPAQEGHACTRLKAYSHVLDFFGGMFEIRDGKAVVPGGSARHRGLGRAGRRFARSGRRISSTS